jgi:putative membrane protein
MVDRACEENMRFLVRLLITAAALWVTVALVPGITHVGPGWQLLVVALVFGLVNAVIRPLLLTLTCPLVVLTLGLFIFVLNALMLWLTGALSGALGIAFQVDGFVPALIGGIVLGLTGTLLTVLVGKPQRQRSKNRL